MSKFKHKNLILMSNKRFSKFVKTQTTEDLYKLTIELAYLIADIDLYQQEYANLLGCNDWFEISPDDNNYKNLQTQKNFKKKYLRNYKVTLEELTNRK